MTKSLVLNAKVSYANPANEFIKIDSYYTGAYVGSQEIEETRYSMFQFPTAPEESERRLVNILIPDNIYISKKAEISEIEMIKEVIEPAFLFFDDSTTSIYRRDDSEDHGPKNYFKSHYPEFDIEKYYLNVIIISFDQYIFTVKKTSENKFIWIRYNINYNLNWVIRKHLKYNLMNLRCLYTIPFDIIFTPIRVILTICTGSPM